MTNRPGPLGSSQRPHRGVIGMSVEQTQQTLDRYFGLMGKDEDFAECLTADVTWLIADTEDVIQGPDAVRDYIIACTREWWTSRVANPLLATVSSTSRGIVLPQLGARAAVSTTASRTR